MHGAVAAESNGANPPGAVRMAVIAFLSFNLSMGVMFGPFGVLIAPIEQRLGVSREISTLAVPVVTFVMSLMAPFIGGLTNRISLRSMMVAGSLLMTAGFAVLAVTDSVLLFIGTYAVLVAPGLCVCGVVAPTTLVTRWFAVNCGRALGLATTPALMAATPLLVAWVVKDFGLTAAFGLLAALMLVCALASLFAVDQPARAPTVAAAVDPHSQDAQAAGDRPPVNVLRDSVFWRIALAGGLYNSVIVMFSTQLVPFATGQGIEPTRAALLLTVYLVGTLVGTPLVGWFADKVGGARMIGFMCVFLGLWQALLLTHPGFAELAVLAGLAGLGGSAMIACMGLALTEQFGQSSFAKAYGTCGLIGLPFAVLSVPVASGVFVRTGSYGPVFLLAVTVLAIGAVLAFSIGGRRA